MLDGFFTSFRMTFLSDMRIKLFTLALLCCCLLQAAEITDSIQVETWQKEAETLPADSCRSLFFARKMLGVPYVAGTLDQNEQEELVVRLDALDCTTFVETVLALVVADKENRRDFQGFKEALTRIRYRGGVLDGYASRLHYISDWVKDNTRKGLVRECTAETSCSRQKELWLDFMTTHVDSYLPMKKDPSLVQEMARYEKVWQGVSVSYIPKERLNESSDVLRIKNGDILAITTSIKGLDVVHVGFAYWKNGRLHLLHASSAAKKVIMDEQTLYDSSKNKKAHTGVRAIRVL